MEWTHIKPKEPGWYWFYGDPFVTDYAIEKYPDDYKWELYMIRVRKISNGVSYIANGNFVENRLKEGFWQKANVPELPA